MSLQHLRAALAAAALASAPVAAQDDGESSAIAQVEATVPVTRELRLAEQASELSARIATMEAMDLAERMSVELAILRAAPQGPLYHPVADGWLYFRPLKLGRYFGRPARGQALDLEEHYTPGGHQLEAIIDLHRQLDERGIELLVVPVPTRLQVYPELLVDEPRGKDFTGYAPGLTRFLLELNEHGVEVIDLLPALAKERVHHAATDDEQVFLRANTHWSPKGVAISARVLAERIREAPWFGEYKTRDLPEPEIFEKAWSYRTQRLAEGAEPPRLEFERVVSGRGRIVEYRKESPVLVMGDSFVWIYSVEGADIARQMHRFTGMPMDMIAIPGGGVQGSRNSLARRKGGPRGKRMVVWLWSSECVMMSPDKWEPVDVFARR